MKLEADYFYDPDGWECTYHIPDLSEGMIDVGENKPKRFRLLREVGEMWLVELDNGDSIETKAFDTEAEAKAAAEDAEGKRRVIED